MLCYRIMSAVCRYCLARTKPGRAPPELRAALATMIRRVSFPIMDPAWGHMVIKMSGHPPWPAQVILNGDEYVAVAAQGEGIGFAKEGNCFTGIADPQGLARVADALSQDAAVRRLSQACNR